MTLREQLAKHSRSPNVHLYHVSMDAMGLPWKIMMRSENGLEEEEGQLTQLGKLTTGTSFPDL